MQLSTIIKSSAARMIAAGISVEVNNPFSWVTISRAGEEDIFLQGDDAYGFMAAVDEYYNNAGDCTREECGLHHAEQYAENLWN